MTSPWLRVCAITMLLGSVSASCSSAEPSNDPFETLATQEQALTGGCGFGSSALQNVGFPCDPDGSGPLAECDHVCTMVASSGGVNVTCQKVPTTAANDGKLCGSSRGTDCTKQCRGSLCVAITAADGTACNPSTTTFGGSHCGGECKTGVCTALPDTARCTETPNNCKLDTCSPKSARTCVGYPVPKGLSCNDGSSCTTGDVCDGAGKCGGTTKTCPASGTPCLVNACDPTTSTGTCIAKPQPGATCAFDKCFAGTCSSTGECVKGTAISCDDMDACTTDSCDATLGCKHEPKTCPANACQVATCDKTSGACSTTPKSCDDGNPCTTDTCDATTGCKNTPIMGCTYTPDAGVDTGGPPFPVDTGVLPVDTGVMPVDTGVVTPDDTGSTVEEDTGTTSTEDTGTSIPTDTGSTTGDDAAADGGAGMEETVEASGCGCRTMNGSGTTAYAALSLAALGLALARRRRSA